MMFCSSHRGYLLCVNTLLLSLHVLNEFKVSYVVLYYAFKLNLQSNLTVAYKLLPLPSISTIEQ